jgi:hypothetical protein
MKANLPCMYILFFDKFLFFLKGVKSFLFIHHLSTIIGGLLLLSGLEAWGAYPAAVFLTQPMPSPNSATAGNIEIPFTAPVHLSILHSGQGCTLSFFGTSVPVKLMDCDGSGTDKKVKEQSLKKGDKIPDFCKIADTSDNCTVQAKLRFTQQPPVGTHSTRYRRRCDHRLWPHLWTPASLPRIRAIAAFSIYNN